MCPGGGGGGEFEREGLAVTTSRFPHVSKVKVNVRSTWLCDRDVTTDALLTLCLKSPQTHDTGVEQVGSVVASFVGGGYHRASGRRPLSPHTHTPHSHLC